MCPGRSERWLQEMRRLRRVGGRVAIDYTDHHLAVSSNMTAFYAKALTHADALLVSSSAMAQQLETYWTGPVLVVADGVEIAPIPPRTTASLQRTLMWFGAKSNLKYLFDFTATRLKGDIPIRLIVLSDVKGLAIVRNTLAPVPGRLDITLAEWSVENMIRAAAQSDLCVIPTDSTDPRKAGASSNRLITAFALGLPVMAGDLASYAPYRDYFTESVSEAFDALLGDPLAFSARAAAAQRDVVPEFMPDRLGKVWTAAIATLA